MIAIDTSSLIAFFSGDAGSDTEAVDDSLRSGVAVFPPAVLAEMLSDPDLPAAIEVDLRRIPVLEVTEGYWERVGQLRRSILKRGKKARLADSLIAQSCIDHNVPLITRDLDFENFQGHSSFKIISMNNR